MSWCIYKHTNKINGKVYIGQTCQQLEDRWQNGLGYSPLYPFGKAIDKYGWENFSHQVIEDNISSVEKANEREIYWIAFFHSYVKDPLCNGYNATKGGDNREHLGKAVYQLDAKTYHIIKEWSTISEAARVLQIDHRSIQRACVGEYRIIGGYCWCFTEDYTEDWELRIDHDKMAVICEDTQIEYESIAEAAAQTKICYSSIARCCKRIQKTAGGYSWRYKHINLENEWVPKTRITEACKRVVCYEDQIIFQSAAEAGRYYKIDASAIAKCCKGKLMTTGGKHFYYEGEKPQIKQPTFGKKKCRCVETQQIFNSTCEASKMMGICQTSIAKVCGGKQKTAGGYHWEYI